MVSATVALIEALYRDAVISEIVDRHHLPRRPAGGDIAARFPDSVALTAALLRDLYADAGCSSAHIELLTGLPQRSCARRYYARPAAAPPAPSSVGSTSPASPCRVAVNGADPSTRWADRRGVGCRPDYRMSSDGSAPTVGAGPEPGESGPLREQNSVDAGPLTSPRHENGGLQVAAPIR